jgi:hypothetical protein
VSLTISDIPKFDFKAPRGYEWLLQHALVDFVPNSSLQPWHYLPGRHIIDLEDLWLSGPSKTRLVAFAKRQDCDNLACFEVIEGRAMRVVIVHGWTGTGYSIELSFKSFWDWLKSVVDDIAEWSEASDSFEE